jgi:hypothetical protein
MIGANLPRPSAFQLQTIQHARNPYATPTGIDFDGQRLAAEADQVYLLTALSIVLIVLVATVQLWTELFKSKDGVRPPDDVLVLLTAQQLAKAGIFERDMTTAAGDGAAAGTM